MNTPWLGAGLSYRHRLEPSFQEIPDELQPVVLEVFPDHFFQHPERLEALAEDYTLVFHEIGLSPGTAPSSEAEEWEEVRLRQLETLMERVRPAMLTEHLALTRSPEGMDIGHLAPLWYNAESLKSVAEKVERWRERLQVDIALENIAAPFWLPGSDWSEAEFFHRLVDKTGCGMLLDLTNHLYNARNTGVDLIASLLEYPLSSAQIVHLAGGFQEAGWWVDSHSSPVEDECFALLNVLFPHAQRSLQTVVVERDDELPDAVVLCQETSRAAARWTTLLETHSAS